MTRWLQGVPLIIDRRFVVVKRVSPQRFTRRWLTGRRVVRLQPRSWPHSRTCDTCSFGCVSEARGVAARQARLVGGRGDLRDGVAYGLVRLRAMIFWIGCAHLDRLITYPDVRNLSGYAAPFATVALRGRAGSPGYAGRIRSLTRTQGVCGHSSGPEHLSVPGAHLQCVEVSCAGKRRRSRYAARNPRG